MKHLSTVLLSAFLITTLSLTAEENKEKPTEKKKETIEDLFSGKVEKYKIDNETKKADTDHPDKAESKREAKEKKVREKLEQMSPEEREKFKQAVKEKIQNMSQEEKAEFIKKLMKERKEKPEKE